MTRYPIGKLRIKTDPVVSHGKAPAIVLDVDSDMDGRSLGPSVFDGVADEVLEELDQLLAIAPNSWQGIVRDHRVALFQCNLQIAQCVS